MGEDAVQEEGCLVEDCCLKPWTGQFGSHSGPLGQYSPFLVYMRHLLSNLEEMLNVSFIKYKHEQCEQNINKI